MTSLTIKARENGPYKIYGTYTYVDEQGQQQTTQGEAMAICRCGHSAKKPFCDGQHRKTGFEAPICYLHLDTDPDTQ
ncbi:MAG: CDGSH iron-sulfur domain-containing protein [Chloroflexota bacterium]